MAKISRRELRKIINEIFVDLGAEDIRSSMKGRGVEAFVDEENILFFKDGKAVGTLKIPEGSPAVKNAVVLSDIMRSVDLPVGLTSKGITKSSDVDILHVVI